MKKLLLATALLGVFCLPLCAADAPKAEVFGGYQFIRFNEINISGFNASVAGNINNTVAIVGDFGFGKKDDYKGYSFTGGPQLSYRADKFRVFGHFLGGGMRVVDQTGLAMIFGGGVDFKVANKIYIRPAQIDLVEYRLNKVWDHQVRYSAGVVFALGSK
jgi:hypothetical protein